MGIRWGKRAQNPDPVVGVYDSDSVSVCVGEGVGVGVGGIGCNAKTANGSNRIGKRGFVFGIIGIDAIAL